MKQALPTKPHDRRRRGPGRRESDASTVLRLKQFFEDVLPILAAGLVILLMAVAVLSVVTWHQQRQLRHAQKQAQMALQLRDAAVRGACVRLQLVRDDVNRVNAAVYRILTLPRPAGSAPVPPISRKVARQAPETNCTQAVEHPNDYRPPAPMPFRRVAKCFDPVMNPRPFPGSPDCKG
jgi:cell division protein FtsL